MGACVNCGSELADDARVCPVCSHPQPKAGAAPPQTITPTDAGTPQADPSQAGWAAPVAPQPPPPQSFPGGPAVYAAPTDSQAVWALVLGLLGIFFCPVIPSIIAIILGRQSEARIRASGGTLSGEGLAKAGWILGIVGLATIVLGLLFIFFVIGMAALSPSGF